MRRCVGEDMPDLGMMISRAASMTAFVDPGMHEDRPAHSMTPAIAPPERMAAVPISS